MSKVFESKELEGFEWDSGNKDKNWIKHKIIIQEAEEVFLNTPLKIEKDIRHSHKEVRFIAFGHTNEFRYLFIVFTIRKRSIRIISARQMDKKEKRYYEK